MILLKQYFYLMLCWLTHSTILPAQIVPVIEWEHSYGYEFSEIALDISATSDNGFIVVGLTQTEDDYCENYALAGDTWIVKLNQFGAKEWERSYGGSEHDEAIVVEEAADHGYWVLATSNSDDGDLCFTIDANCGVKGGKDIWLLKLDAQGDLQWEKSYGGSRDETATELLIDADGNVIIVGSAFSEDGDVLSGNNAQAKVWVVKIDEEGKIIEEATYGQDIINHNEVCEAALLLENNDLLMSGHTRKMNPDSNATFFEVFVRKIAAVDTTLWSKTYGGSLDDIIYDLVPAADGGFIMIGSTKSIDGDVGDNETCRPGPYNQNHYNCRDIWLVKIDAAGAIEYERSYGGTSSDVAYKILPLGATEFLIVGQSSSNDADFGEVFILGNDIALLKVTETPDSFRVDWRSNLGSKGLDGCFTALVQADSSIVIAGFSNGADTDITQNAGCQDFWIAKLSADCDDSVPLAQPILVADSLICENKSLVLSIATVPTSEDITYYWQTPNGTLTSTIPQISIDDLSAADYSGEYSLIIEVAGCPSPVSDALTIGVLPTFENEQIDTMICSGYSVSFAGNVYDETGIYEVFYEADSSCDSFFLLNLTVLAATDSLCSFSLTDNFNALVSPNGDGINDVLKFKDILLYEYPNNILQIFDRLGNAIYQASPYFNDWNGTNTDGLELPNGTYYYVLALGTENHLKGHITLLTEK